MNDYAKHSELTICSVYHSVESKRLLELNYDLVKRMNPNAVIKWIVADNSPQDCAEKISDGRFTVISGAADRQDIPSSLVGSYHHADACNLILPHIATEFAVFLDNDFFIISPRWIEEVVSYMRQNNLGFFGAPFSPSCFIKYRYFPCVQCIFIDLKKVDKAVIDFTPQYNIVEKEIKKRRRDIIGMAIIGRRWKIGASRDTGYKLYDRFFHSDIGFECVQPVFRQKNTMKVKVNNLFDRILPDSLSYRPKRADYYSSVSFRKRGYVDVLGQGWEETFWHQKPFSLHLRLRGVQRLTPNLESGLARIRSILARFPSDANSLGNDSHLTHAAEVT